jgi:hypothetical protein
MHNTGVYNEDTKIWQLSDKIMQVVGGDSCNILMSASTTQETIFPPARKCSQMASYSLQSYARSYPFPQVDACVPIIEFKEKIGIEAILVPQHNL